jgi:hypothetical protein
MHYDTHAFGKTDAMGRQLPTIIQKPPKHREMILPIWARPFLSRLDAVEINVVYEQACLERDRALGARSQGRIHQGIKWSKKGIKKSTKRGNGTELVESKERARDQQVEKDEAKSDEKSQ